VSLGSSTAQLHECLGSRRACAYSEDGFSSQNGDCAWGLYYRRAAICCAFWWALNAKDILKEMILVYGGKCLSRKIFRWWRRCRNGDAEVAETTVKRFLCCEFRRTGKAMGQVYQCWWRICREINVFFQVSVSHVLRFISIYDLFTDSPLQRRNTD
jgi:hypothetical protein